MHPHPLGEAKRQIERLTADERRELGTMLLVMERIVQEVEESTPTEIDYDIDHRAIVSNGRFSHEQMTVRRGGQIPPRFSQR
jgi:hypothetical protein